MRDNLFGLCRGKDEWATGHKAWAGLHEEPHSIGLWLGESRWLMFLSGEYFPGVTYK